MARAVPETRFGHVRRFCWVVLGSSVVLALLVPALTLWHTASQGLRAQLCVWPVEASVGAPVYVLVVPTDAQDRAALAGPWAHATLTSDMVGMHMDTRPVLASGRPGGASAFSVPVRMDMAGEWQIHVTVQTPGRPDWNTSLRLVVSAGTGAATAADVGASSPPARAPCGGAPRSSSA